MASHDGRPAAASSASQSGVPARQSSWLEVPGTWLPRSPRQAAVVAVRLIAVAGLSVDAYVHLDLASTYSEAQAPINEGILFRAEAVLALLTALALIVYARRLSFLLGFAVSASALTLMLISRYVDLGPIGPFPDLYDPVWFLEKLWAAGGEAAAAIASATGILLLGLRIRERRAVTPAKAPRRRHIRFGSPG